MNSKSIFWVGNFLPLHRGSPPVSGILSQMLGGQGWKYYSASSFINPFYRYLDIVFSILKQRKKYSIAHIDTFSGKYFFAAETAAGLFKQLNKPYILTLHGGNLPVFAEKNSGRVKALITSAACVIAPSKYLAEEMKTYRKDIQIIPNPLDITSYSFSPKRSVSPRLIWLRAFHSVYNPELAVKVLKLLIRDFPEASLTMIGPDKKDGSLQRTQKLASELELTGRVLFESAVPKTEVPKRLQMADIFLNTSHVDNAPVSVIEAMGCGLCVVSTNVGGVPYLLENQKEAVLVSPDNPEEMASAVHKILKDPDFAAGLSQNARNKAEQSDWSVVLPMWNRLFSSLL